MADYEKLYSDQRYREEKPKTFLYCDIFMSLFYYVMENTNAQGIGVDETIIDWGCGNGAHAMKFSDQGLDVVGLVDIAPNSLDERAKAILEDVFEAGHLKDASPKPAHWSYCSDVLEHLEYEDIDASLINIVRHTKRPGFIYLNVATRADIWDGEDLHVIKESQQWWHDKMKDIVNGLCIFTANMSNDTLTTFWHLR